MNTARIWTDDEFLEVDLSDIGELESAMGFKAEHIKAKADPQLFEAVADALSKLWNKATEEPKAICRINGLPCSDCQPCCGSRSVIMQMR